MESVNVTFPKRTRTIPISYESNIKRRHFYVSAQENKGDEAQQELEIGQQKERNKTAR